MVDLPMGPMPITYGLVDTCSVYRNSRPDLTDPATLGCLMHLVREAWAPNVVVFGGWRAVHIYAPTADTQWVEGDLAPYVWESDALDEAEALVTALEAAP